MDEPSSRRAEALREAAAPVERAPRLWPLHLLHVTKVIDSQVRSLRKRIAMRAHVDDSLPGPSGFPYPTAGVG